MELLQGLSDLLIWDLALTLFLVIVVQATALQLLQVVLRYRGMVNLVGDAEAFAISQRNVTIWRNDVETPLAFFYC